MDVGAGHFARLSFATESDFSVPLVKNLSLLANNALEAFRTQSSQSSAIAQLDTEGTPLSVPFVTTQEVVSDTFNEEHLHQDVSGFIIFKVLTAVNTILLVVRYKSQRRF